MNRTFFFIVLTFILVAIDWYVWQGLRFAIRNLAPATQRWIGQVYWVFTAMTLMTYVAMQLLPPDYLGKTARTFIFAFIAIPYLSKLLGVVILLIDDIRRFLQWIVSFFAPSVATVSVETGEPTVPRSEFLATAAIAASAGLMGTFAFGIISRHQNRTAIRHTFREFF
jgi:hypothetical protein